MSGALDDLRQRWAEELRERDELAAVRDLEDLDLDEGADGESVDREAALRRLREEPEDDQPYRRCA